MSERLEVHGRYLDARSEIVRPDEVVVTTRYFFRRWAPRLGPVATAVLVALRRRCYLNRQTGEERDVCFPRIDELAEEIGINRKTVMRALGVLELEGFVQRSRRFRPTPARMLSRLPDRYRVLLEDPVAPEDRDKAAALELERSPESPEMGPISPTGTCGDLDLVSPSFAEQSRNGTNLSVRNGHQRRPLLEANASTVETFNGARKRAGQREITDSRIRNLVLDAEEILGDRRSRGFLVIVASRMPEDAIRSALSDTREAAREGRIRGPRGAYFVGIVRRMAEELNVSLTGKAVACSS